MKRPFARRHSPGGIPSPAAGRRPPRKSSDGRSSLPADCPLHGFSREIHFATDDIVRERREPDGSILGELAGAAGFQRREKDAPGRAELITCDPVVRCHNGLAQPLRRRECNAIGLRFPCADREDEDPGYGDGMRQVRVSGGAQERGIQRDLAVECRLSGEFQGAGCRQSREIAVA